MMKKSEEPTYLKLDNEKGSDEIALDISNFLLSQAPEEKDLQTNGQY